MTLAVNRESLNIAERELVGGYILGSLRIGLVDVRVQASGQHDGDAGEMVILEAMGLNKLGTSVEDTKKYGEVNLNEEVPVGYDNLPEWMYGWGVDE